MPPPSCLALCAAFVFSATTAHARDYQVDTTSGGSAFSFAQCFLGNAEGTFEGITPLTEALALADDGALSLREALCLANLDDEDPTIALPAGETIVLSEIDNTFYAPNALPIVTRAIVIFGHGATLERASNAPAFRFFYVAGPFHDTGVGALTLVDLTLSGGLAKGGDGGYGGAGAGFGGAIYSQGELVLERVRFVGNAAVGGNASSSTPSGGGMGSPGGFTQGGGFATASGGWGGNAGENHWVTGGGGAGRTRARGAVGAGGGGGSGWPPDTGGEPGEPGQEGTEATLLQQIPAWYISARGGSGGTGGRGVGFDGHPGGDGGGQPGAGTLGEGGEEAAECGAEACVGSSGGGGGGGGGLGGGGGGGGRGGGQDPRDDEAAGGNGGAGGGGVGGGGGTPGLGGRHGQDPGGGGGFGGGGGLGASRFPSSDTAGGGSGGPGGFGGGGGGGGASWFTSGGAGAPGGFGGGHGGSGAGILGQLIEGRGGGGAGMGGAIFNHGGEVSATSCLFVDNRAAGGSGRGDEITDPNQNNGSQGGQGLGGAIFNLNGAVHLRHASLIDNRVTGGGGEHLGGAGGGALYNHFEVYGVGNTILGKTAGTTTIDLTDSIVGRRAGTELPAGANDCDGSGVAVTSSWVHSGCGQSQGSPPLDDMLVPLVGSALIDTASGSPGAGEHDLAGLPRAIDGDADGAAAADLGAFERWPAGVILVDGPDPLVLVAGSAFVDPGARVMSDDGTLIALTTDDAVDTSVLGRTTVTYEYPGSLSASRAVDVCNDVCNGGACTGPVVRCSDGNVCTDDACDVDSAQCTTTPNSASCTDGNACTVGDRCASGTCVGGGARSCNDNNDCTDDACDPARGCTFTLNTAPCDDGDPGTWGDRCSAGTCVSVPVACAPAGVCEVPGTPAGVESCPAVPRPAGVSCDDGDLATRDDACDGAGACRGTAIVCEPPSGPCELAGVPDGSGCAPVYANAGASCDDGDPGTRADRCDGAGGCSGEAIACPAETPCATWAPDGDGCVMSPRSGPCDDGDLATRDDRCDALGACGGTPIICLAGACELSSLPDGEGCAVVFAEAGANCDDGDLATRDDRCDGGGACGGTPYACTPGMCQRSSVPDGVGCAVSYADPGSACDDGDACTIDDACDGAGRCVGAPDASEGSRSAAFADACGEGERCDALVGCRETHCEPCDDDLSCGPGAACVDTELGPRCLLGCERDEDCPEGRLCRGALDLRSCYDPEGACGWIETAEPGPEETEAVEVVEVVEPADVSEPTDVSEPPGEVVEPEEPEEIVDPSDGSPDGSEVVADTTEDVDPHAEVPEEIAEGPGDETDVDEADDVVTPDDVIATEPSSEVSEPSAAEAETRTTARDEGCAGGPMAPGLVGLAFLALRRRLAPTRTSHRGMHERVTRS